MSEKLSQLFLKCLSPNNNIRISAEKELSSFCNLYFYQTLKESSLIINKKELAKDIRQFGGTFLKYIFCNEQYLNLWNKLNTEQIELVKNNLMESLASEEQEVRQSSSLAIAALAKVEIPKGWNVINVLYNTSNHENANYRITSLLTFTNIVDFMGARLKQDEINIILGAYTNNMDLKLHQKVLYQAVHGIYNIIPFVEKNFNNEAQREFIINSLNNIMDINYIKQSGLDENVQKEILITYIQIMKYYTINMTKSFSKIAEISFRYFHNNNQVLSALSLEIWCTICDKEQECKTNLITSNYQDTLNNGIIRIIQERNFKSFDLGDEWDSIKASTALISCLVLSGNKKVLDKMLSYISECLNNELLQKSETNFETLTNEEKIKSLFIKQNAFLIYRGVLSFQELDPDIIMSSLQKIISELNNKNILPIGVSIAKCLVIICKVHFNLINEKKGLFNDFFEQILHLIEIHINDKEVEYYLLYVVKYIFINANPEYFNNYLTNILTILMQIAYAKGSYNKDCNLASTSLFLTSRIIDICINTEENKKIIQEFFAKIYTLFEESLDFKYFNDLEEQYCFQNGIISIISSCCGGESLKITMNQIQIKCVFNLIEKCILQRKSLFYEAIMVIGNLSYFGWDLFSNINEKAMNYLLLSLDDKQDFELCYQGLIAADDIIRNLGNENIILIPKIVEKMRKIIRDSDTPRGLKIKCFPLYNDIFLLLDKSFGEYLGEAMQLIMDGMSISMEPPNKETDKDTKEYFDEFREKIVELLSGVFFFLSEQKQTNAISPYIVDFIKYLSKIVQPDFNPNNNLLSEVGGLLADLYNYFKATVQLYLNKESLENILQKLEQSQNPQHKENLLYIQQIFSDFYNY